MNWEFHPEALQEFDEATRYYAERDPTLALRFVDAVEDAIRRIVEAPSAWRILDDDVRRCPTHVFPYGVLYTIEPELVLVVAVMHGSREPGYLEATHRPAVARSPCSSRDRALPVQRVDRPAEP